MNDTDFAVYKLMVDLFALQTNFCGKDKAIKAAEELVAQLKREDCLVPESISFDYETKSFTVS